MPRSSYNRGMDILILGKKIPVIFTKNLEVDGEASAGAYDAETRTIEINEDLRGTDRAIEILMHESGHALLDRIGLWGRLPPDLEEVIVESFKNLYLENDFKSLSDLLNQASLRLIT